MLFTDHLHGTIDFRGTPYSDLIYGLLGCPEVQRLRHMRLMNFDVPYIQDLASTKRFPHCIGTCFLAYKTVEKTSLPLIVKKKIIIAALIHDIGILPFGHLLESIIKSKDKSFSHENLVYSILMGTYHPTNLYHQILGAEPLRLHKVIKLHGIDPLEIYKMICPDDGKTSSISANVDLDNIDNVHRMATLLGYDRAKINLKNLIQNVTINKDLNLAFYPDAIPHIEEWLKMRQSIYTMIIGHPECVPYNAFLSTLLKLAVNKQIVTQDEWYITDSVFESRLLTHSATRQLAKWLLVRPHYELVDYIWFISNDKPKIDLYQVEKHIVEQNFKLPRKADYFFWTENKLISREVKVKLISGEDETIGINSHSILVSLVKKSSGMKQLKTVKSENEGWRTDINNFIKSILPDWKFSVKYPSDYNQNFFNSKIANDQLTLFK